MPLLPDIELEFSVDLHPDALTTQEISRHVMLLDAETERSFALNLISPQTPVRSKRVVLRPTSSLDPQRQYLFVVLPSLPAYTGRTAGVRRVFSFRTGTPALMIPEPVPLSPGYNAQVTALPVQLAWDVWASPPSGYTLLYEVELARDERFADLVWHSVLQGGQVQVPENLIQQGSYAWRVRGLLRQNDTETITPGKWSQTSFFFYRPASPPPSYTGGSVLEIRTSIDGVVMALQSSWPELVLYDAPDSYGSVNLYWRDADGYPSWEWRQSSISIQVTDTNPSDGVVDRITVSVNEPIGVSRAYRLALVSNDGRTLWEKLFYANLRPLYCHPDVVKYRVGSLAASEGMDDDDICFYIFRKSLEANRHFYRYVLVGWAGPQESSIRSMDIGQYFSVQRWVEIQATIEVLSHLLLRLSSRIGSRQRLGDYLDEYEADAVREIRELRKQLQKESIQWLSEFSKLRAVAVSASKSSWNPLYAPGGPHEHPIRSWRRPDRWRP